SYVRYDRLTDTTLAYISAYVLFTNPPPPALYTLSLHDALPIYLRRPSGHRSDRTAEVVQLRPPRWDWDWMEDGNLALDRHELREDRKSTRLNSSHVAISYAVFCLKKKNKIVKAHGENTLS